VPVEILMPELSSDMSQADLVAWLVKPGDHVDAGDLIAELETEKSTVEFEAPTSGTLVEIVVPAGTNAVEVGTVIALFERAPDAAAEPAAEPVAEPGPAAETPAAARVPEPPPEALATALARRIALQAGIELDAVAGSGHSGRIVKADLQAGLQTGTDAKAPAATTPPVQSDSEIPSQSVPLSRMRRTIATRLAESKQTIPHFYLSVECEIDSLLEMRARFNAEERRISVNDFVVRAAALALVEVPDANVSFQGDTLTRYERADVAVAVATEGGLITPVVREANHKELATISAEVRELAARARAGKLHPREYQGGSFTVSNLGMYGIDSVYPIVNPPQSCILGVGAGRQKPVVRNGELAIGTVMVCTLSADHRAVDGAVGAQLLAAVKQRLEDPLGMLL
jgi:pyruvate dehydrogenase E2 component (dihydrolipoamide acetyltransferase)